MPDHPITSITLFMIERHGAETASIAETFAVAHLIVREDDGAKLWADVAEEAKQICHLTTKVSFSRPLTR